MAAGGEDLEMEQQQEEEEEAEEQQQQEEQQQEEETNLEEPDQEGLQHSSPDGPPAGGQQISFPIVDSC